MKLNLSTFLSSDDQRMDFDGKLCENDTDLNLDNLNLIFPIEYSGYVHDLTGELVLSIDISYSFNAECDRCTANFVNHKETRYEAFNFKNPSFYDEDSTDEYFEINEDSIDLSKIILSQVITSIPGKNLCSEDCKGLCPHCGQNLNEGDCNCENSLEVKREKVDPRFEKLLDLFKDEEV